MKGIILLWLLLLLAGVSQADKAADCRVHQIDSTWCWIKPPKDSCIVNSHWVDTCATPDTSWYFSTLLPGPEMCPIPRHMVVRYPDGHADTTLFEGCIVADKDYRPVDTCALRDSIMAKHRDSNDPNNLPCPKGYHGIRDGSFVIDTDPPTYCYHCHPDTVESDTLPDAVINTIPFPILIDSAVYDKAKKKLYVWPPFLDSAELAILKQIAAERREKDEADSIYAAQHTQHIFCPFCHHCVPEWVEAGVCTAIYCIEDCCNSCTNTYQCRTTGAEFDITVKECVSIVWDTVGWKESMK